MSGQLGIFHGSGPDSPPTSRPPQEPVEERATTQTSPPAASSGSGQPDDGSLHWMMTGKPEPKPLRTSACRSCGATIIWVRTERDRKMPLDWEPVADARNSTYALFVLREPERSLPLAIQAWGLEDTEPHYHTHFDTCGARKAAA